METAFRFQIVDDLAAAEALRPAWAVLAGRSFRNEITQSPDWLLTWWQVFGQRDGRQLRLGTLYDGERLIGLAPLLWRRHRYGGVVPFRRLEFLGSGEHPSEGIYSNHLSILAEAGAEAYVARAFARAILDETFGSWDEVVLTMMAADTPLPGLLADAFSADAFTAAGLTVETAEIAQAPYIPLPATWDDYLQRLSANGRRNIRRSLKALTESSMGESRLIRVTDVAELEQAKSILMRLHQRRWNDAGVFRMPAYVQFHDALMRRLLSKGSLLLTWLRLGDEPVGAFYGMEWAGKVYAYQLGRHTDVANRLRPGATLLALLIRQAIEAGHGEFDLLADDAPFKRQLTSHARPLVRLRVARRSFAEAMRRAAKQSRDFLCRIGGRSQSEPEA
jgi:CelD/BcsL family acetyltransferase involved in cellulose biosynthesis